MAEDAFGIVGSVIASAYHVQSVVAEGGFGTVYRAHHGGFRAPVALKCLRLPVGLAAEERQRFLDAFRAEAELLFQLSASIPTVVRPLHVDAFATADGRLVPYLVLEWLEGCTLDALIRARRAQGQAPFSLKESVRLLTPVARALERAHNFQGPSGPVSIVHRDVKPENIFVASLAGEEQVKILDFGIGKAKSLVSQVAGRTSQGSSAVSTFTPAYGSPEQWAPKRYGQTGPWTDVWGLALTLSEALVGRPVIDGDAAAILGSVLDPVRRPSPGSEGVVVAPAVERVFAKALALDPRERYADAGAFWNELLLAARLAEPDTGAPGDSFAATRLPSSASHAFEVPDLDLVPPRRVSSGRVPSSSRTAASLSVGLDDAPEALDAGPALDLDLPNHDPFMRRASSRGMPAVGGPELQSDPPTNPAAFEHAASSAPLPPTPLTRGVAPPSAPTSLSAEGTPSPPVSRAGALQSASHLLAALSALRPRTAAFRLAAEPDATLVQRLLPGGAVLGGAILATLLDQLYSAVSGQVFTVGGLRTSVLAGLAMAAGLSWCVYRLKRD